MWHAMRMFDRVIDFLTLSLNVISRKCCRRAIGKGLSWNLHIFIHSKQMDPKKRKSFLLLDEEISDSDTYLPMTAEEEKHEVTFPPDLSITLTPVAPTEDCVWSSNQRYDSRWEFYL